MSPAPRCPSAGIWRAVLHRDDGGAGRSGRAAVLRSAGSTRSARWGSSRPTGSGPAPHTAAHSGTASADTHRAATNGRRASPRPAPPAATPVSADPDPQRIRGGVVRRQPLGGDVPVRRTPPARPPTSAAHGSHISRQRRLRQPIAAISTTPRRPAPSSAASRASAKCVWRKAPGTTTSHGNHRGRIPWDCL